MSRFLNSKKVFLLIVFLMLLFILIFLGLKVCQQNNVNNWKVYRNLELGYEIKYPGNWYVKENGRDNCKQTKVGEGVVCIEKLAIENKKERVILVEAGPCEACEKQPITKNGSYFRMTIYEVTSPHISSIEKWIQSLYIPEKVKQERLAAIQIIEIGGKRMKAWKGSAGGIEFFYEDKVYRISCGSNKPFGLDSKIFETMLNSFKTD